MKINVSKIVLLVLFYCLIFEGIDPDLCETVISEHEIRRLMSHVCVLKDRSTYFQVCVITILTQPGVH